MDGEKLQQGIDALKVRFFKLSKREQAIIGVLIAYVVVWSGYTAFEMTRDAFEAQSLKLAKLEGQVKNAPRASQGYLKLLRRRKAIETRYKSLASTSSASARIESALKKFDKIDSNTVKLDQKMSRTFADGFEQLQYQVEFQIEDYPQMAEVLKELSSGEPALQLLRIKLSRLRNGQRLGVELDMSSIRRTGVES